MPVSMARWCKARVLVLATFIWLGGSHVPAWALEIGTSAPESLPIVERASAYSTAPLPVGLDPSSVVRRVRGYRANARALAGDDGVYGVSTERADEVTPPFQIGVGGSPPEPAELNQYIPSVAFDGTNYLVVWEDRRDGFYDIYGARVTPGGEVLDPGGIWITEGSSAGQRPSVAFDGTNYLVVWQDFRNGLTHIYGTRVSVEGIVQDSMGFAISSPGGIPYYPSVACDGVNCLVVWSDYRTGLSDIYGARVSASGTVLDTNGIAISLATRAQLDPCVAFNGTDYLVAWTDYGSGEMYDIYGARVSTNGTVLDTAGIEISTAVESQSSPAVGSDGVGWLVVWEDLRSSSLGGGDSIDVYASRVSSSGAVLDTAGIPVSAAASAQLSASVCFDGANYLVVWCDFRAGSNDIYSSRVSIAGTVINTDGVIVSAAPKGQYAPGVAFGGTDYFVVWQDYRNVQWDIYGARVSTESVVLDTAGVAISVVGTNQWDVAVGFDGTNYLVLWSDGGGDLWDIYGVRVSVDGTLLDPNALTISAAPGVQRLPAVAFDGANYLVLWEDRRNGSRDIYGTRVSVGGTVLDTAGIVISAAADDQRAPAVAFDSAGTYLVVWEDWRKGSWDIYGTRVNMEGTVLDMAGTVISATPGDQRTPRIAYGGTRYLVVWEHGEDGSWDIHGRFVSREGTALGSGSFPISTASNYQFSPDVAFDGTNYLVVWSDQRNGVALDIYGARVSGGGMVLEPLGIHISTASNHQMLSTVLFDGTDYVVVWEDGRNGLPDIYGARVSVYGFAIDTNGLVIASSPGEQFSPAIANGPVCSALIVYTSYTQPKYRSYRTWGSIWSGPTTILFASARAECSGAHVSLAWDVTVEVSALSFTIERADSIHGEYSPRAVRITQDSWHSYSCVDEEVEIGKTYWYMIVLGDPAVGTRYGPLEVKVSPPAVAWALHQSFPNPLSPTCTIRYDVAEAGPVRLRVFDVAGRVVRTLVEGWREPGVHKVLWDGSDDGKELASGVYFCALEAGGFRAVRKIVVSR